MSTFSVPLEVGDPAGGRFEAFEALVDAGSTFTVLPGATLRRLGVSALRTSIFELGDGTQMEWAVGQTWVRLNDLALMTQIVFGEDGAEPILGAVTLEEFLLAVDPVRQELVPVRGLAK